MPAKLTLFSNGGFNSVLGGLGTDWKKSHETDDSWTRENTYDHVHYTYNVS
jgi:hypothetical protein